jgi:hypothetical protein
MGEAYRPYRLRYINHFFKQKNNMKKTISQLYSTCSKISKAEYANAVSQRSCSRTKPTAHNGYGISITLLIVVFLFLTGCGRHEQLKGKVVFGDGKPLTTGMVVLDDGKKVARAPIQPDGTFTAGTEKENNGLPAGTYKVCITGAEVTLDNPEEIFPPPSRQLIHKKYTDTETSGLTITVDKSINDFTITVEPPETPIYRSR